ncbi:unnamed protein product [Ixodes hexagonus]
MFFIAADVTFWLCFRLYSIVIFGHQPLGIRPCGPLLRSITRANHLSGVFVSLSARLTIAAKATTLSPDSSSSPFSWLMVIACWVGTVIVGDGCWGWCRMRRWPLHSRDVVDFGGVFSSDARRFVILRFHPCLAVTQSLGFR